MEVNNLTVTPIPSFGKKKISSFMDKNDLIRCNMASVHLVSQNIQYTQKFTDYDLLLII